MPPINRRPLWLELPWAALLLLLWPAVIAPALWRARRFQRVAKRADGFRLRIVAEGVEVWRGDEASRRISWAKLHAGRWLVHHVHSTASGYEESYAVELLEEGVALGGYRGELDLVFDALATRHLRPEPEDGGRGLGAAGWLMTTLWFGAAALAVVVLLFSPALIGRWPAIRSTAHN